MTDQAVKTVNHAAIIAVCFLVTTLEGFDIQTISVAAPTMAPALGLTKPQIGLLFSMGAFGIIIGAFLGGPLADKFGRRWTMFWSVICFGASSLVTGVANTLEILNISRFSTGLGIGAVLPSMMALAAEIGGKEKSASTASMMFCGLAAGGIAAACVTLLIPTGFDWRLIFIIGGLLPVIIAPIVLIVMKHEGASPAKASITKSGSLSELLSPQMRWQSLLLWFGFFQTFLVLFLVMNWLPTISTERGIARSLAPYTALAFNGGALMGGLVIGQIADKFGFRWTLVVCYVGLILSLLSAAFAFGLTKICAATFAASFFLLGAQYVLYGVVPTYYPIRVRATGSGTSIAVGRLGSVVGPYGAGLVLGAGASSSTLLIAVTPIAMLAGASMVAVSYFKPATD